MRKNDRAKIYMKYNQRCAYCGRPIEYKDMQVDHIDPQRRFIEKDIADRPENLNPSCRRCNHYKREQTIEVFRETMLTLHERVRKIYICKVAEDYGIIEVKPWDGIFYYEKVTK